MPPHTHRPPPRAITRVCNTSIALRQHRTIWQEHSAKDFASYESYKRVGILYVFSPFITARMGQKIGRRPQTQLCGDALKPFGSLLLHILIHKAQRIVFYTFPFNFPLFGQLYVSIEREGGFLPPSHFPRCSVTDIFSEVFRQSGFFFFFKPPFIFHSLTPPFIFV